MTNTPKIRIVKSAKMEANEVNNQQEGGFKQENTVCDCLKTPHQRTNNGVRANKQRSNVKCWPRNEVRVELRFEYRNSAGENNGNSSFVPFLVDEVYRSLN